VNAGCAIVAAALGVAGCGTNIAETATLPPRPHAASPSAEVIGVTPSEIRTESETPVTTPPRAEIAKAHAATSRTKA
jgi:hypothetical protein